jgi:hypothetical protein
MRLFSLPINLDLFSFFFKNFILTITFFSFQVKSTIKMQRQIVITFTAAEVDARIVAGQQRFLKKNEPAMENIQPYTNLLCEKISQSVPSHSEFRVVEGFREEGSGIVRAYVKCLQHQMAMPVTYRKADLHEHTILHLTIKVKCEACLGVAIPPALPVAPVAPMAPVPPVAQVPPPAPVEVVVPPVMPPVVINAPNQATAIFEQVSRSISEVLSRAYAQCSVADDPVQELRNNQLPFGNLIIDAFNNCIPAPPQVADVAQAEPAAVANVEPEPGPSGAATGSNDGGAVGNAHRMLMSQAQRRMRETRANIAKRRRRQ